MASPKMRVATSGTDAVAENYADSTPNAGLVLTSKGPGVRPDWLPASANYAANWAVANWYIDGGSGSDANDGLTAATPIQHGAELLRRLGPYAIWPQSVTIHIGAGGMLDPLVLSGVLTTLQTHVDIIGTPTSIPAGTIATYSFIDHTTAKGPQVTTSGIADFTAYAGSRLRLTSGAQTGLLCWIAKANPPGTTVATARTCRWSKLDIVDTFTLYDASPSPPIGATAVIDTLPKVPAISIHLDGMPGSTGDPDWDKRQYSIRDVKCAHTLIGASRLGVNPGGIVFGCKVSDVNFAGGKTTYLLSPQVGCCWYLDDATPGGTNAVFPTGTLDACLIGDTAGAVPMFCNILNSPQTVMNSVLCEGVELMIGPGSPNINDLQVFNCSDALSAALTVVAGTDCILSKVSGLGNAGVGISVENNVSLALNSTVARTNLQGAVADWRFQSSPAVLLTAAQAMVSSDHGQHGVATIGATAAGYVTVAVPWWDPATQSLTFGRNTPAGTIGDLSAPSANRTSSAFRLASANVLDTSTVDWQISPLGRNIFIRSR